MENVHLRAKVAYDEVTKTRDGDLSSKEVPFRRFNNFVKGKLIQNSLNILVSNLESEGYVPQSDENEIYVLDLACGRGGDIFKWTYATSQMKVSSEDTSANIIDVKVAEYHGYDISPEAIKQASYRCEVNPVNNCRVLFEVVNCFDDEFRTTTLLKNPRYGMFGVVSCMFAIHYACDSERSLLNILQLISDSLRKGGVFIVTMIDSRKLLEYLRGNPTKNKLFSITLPSNSSFPKEDVMPVGFLYNFILEGFVECSEYIVPFDLFLAIASTVKLRLLDDYSVPFMEEIPHFQKVKRNRALANLMTADEKELISLYHTLLFVKD